MYRLAVCEDEERARGALCALCGEILDGWGVEHSVAAFSSAEELEGALSDLERRVLYLHLLGTDYRTIARLLDKSPKTVDNAIQRIKAKTQKILRSEEGED